jgi:hypothetical protein
MDDGPKQIEGELLRQVRKQARVVYLKGYALCAVLLAVLFALV